MSLPEHIQRSLPSHLSERTFRILEPHIFRAVKRWPDETQFARADMQGEGGALLSPHTFAARFRDALTSLKRFGWTTDIDTVKLWSITGSFVVAFANDGTVWFKARGRRGRPTELTQEARALGVSAGAYLVTEPWLNPSQEELDALCLLITPGRIVGPVILSTLVDAEACASLEATHNVAVVVHTEHQQTVIT